MRTRSREIPISNLIIFAYAWLCCLNQLYKIIGVPVFIYFLGLSCVLILSKTHKLVIYKQGITLAPMWWLICATIQCLFLNSGDSWHNYVLLLVNIIGFLLIQQCSIRDESYIHSIFGGIIGGTICNLVVAFNEVTRNQHVVPLTVDYQRRFSYRPLGYFVNTNDFSVVLFSAVMLAVTYYLWNKSHLTKKRRFIIGLFVITCVAFLYIAFSTTCMLLLPAAVVLAFLFYKMKSRNSIFWRVLVALTLVLLLLGMMFLWGFDFSIEPEVYSTGGRMEIWSDAIKHFIETPVWGIGCGQSSIVEIGMLHNIALEILVEYGLIVFIPVTYMFISLIVFLWKRASTPCDSVILTFTILLPFLSITSSSITKIFPAWVVLGIMLAIERRKDYDFNSSSNLSV